MSKYSWNAQDYKKYSSGQKVWADELLARLEPNHSDSILDLGCGDGKITVELAKLVPNGFVLGGDYSEAMIALAKSEHEEKFDNLSFQILDARKLDFVEEFDVVFSNAALHWVIDHKPVIEGIYKSLKTDGRILLQMGGQGNAADVIAVINEIIRQDWQEEFRDFEFPYGFYGVEEYEDLLTGVGFKVDRLELIPKDMIHDGIEGLRGWLRTTWLPYTQRIPEQQRDGFINQIAKNYLDKYPLDADNKAHVAMMRIEVEARKFNC